MEKNPNRPAKGRNKFNPNQTNNINNIYGKRSNKMIQMMNYENNLNNPFIQNQEYIMNTPYQMQNMYTGQMPMSLPQSKEQNIKNMFKAYQNMPKKTFYQFNPNEYMPNMGENEMSLEDNAQYGSKKFVNKNWNKPRIPKKRKNINKSNKELNNMIETGQGNNRAISSENNYDENFPEAYFKDDINYNNYGQRGGKKKAITVDNRNRNKKGFNRNYKRYHDNNYENTNNSDFSDSEHKKNNIITYYNKSNNISEVEEDSNLANNDNYSNEEQNEDEEDKNSQDIIIVEDNNSTTPKEVIDIKKIKLIEKTDSNNDIINIKSSISINNKVPSSTPVKQDKKTIIPELTEMCSEKEIEEREKERDLDRFEIDANSFPIKKPDKARMIQKYQRKRGKILNLNDPKEIRNISAINKSILYLIEEILDCDTNDRIKLPQGFSITPMDIINFITDRFIAIYKTIEILYDNDNNILKDNIFLENIVKMIRTIVIFFNLCLDYYDDESPKEINSLIDNLLSPLLNYIKDIIINETKYEFNLSVQNKDELISYYLLIKLKKERKNFLKHYEEIKDIVSDIEKYQKIKLVHEIYTILNNKKYNNFMNILKENDKCDYLTSCFLSLFFKEICVIGLVELSLIYKELTYREILDLLTFEDTDEIRKFLIWYGITKDKTRHIVNDSDTVPLNSNTKIKKYDYDKAPQKTNIRYVEKKRGTKLRKDIVSTSLQFIRNNNYNNIPDINNKGISKIEEEKVIIKNTSLISSDINNDKTIHNIDNNDINDSNSKKDIKDILNINSQTTNKNNNLLDESFISKSSYNKLFPSSTTTTNQNIKITLFKENSNKSEKKITSSTKNDFLKPLSPKKISFDIDKPSTTNFLPIDTNKSLDIFSQPSISSIEGPSKYYSNINEQTIEFFCEVSSSIINKIIENRKLDFIYKLKFIVEKYKIKLELIENYINRRKFFVFNEFKKCCLNKKYSKEYYKELVNYNNNLNAENTNENLAFKNSGQNLMSNKKFELLTYEDIIYFLIKDYEIIKQKKLDVNNEEIELINHLQINIYTTKDLIKSTKIIATLKLKKNLLQENSDGSELTIIDNNININANNKLSLIIKFIFVDQIIDLDSYIYDNQKNISKYSILIPFFDIIKSDPENQQILTKFFTILDIGLGSFIKKDIIFFFIKRDIEQTSDLYKDYQNIQNDFIFNLMQKYSNNSNKNNIIYIDDDYENNEKVKEKIIYLSPIDEFGKCYQEYIKYLNNKTFVELFENNKLFSLNVFNPKEKFIPFEKHILQLDLLIKYYINNIENDLQKYLTEINCVNYFYNNKLCIEILIGILVSKILLIYYQYLCISFANELFKIPFYNSNNELLILEDNLLNSGSILRQINLDGYEKFWNKCFNLDVKKKKNMFTYFDIFSEIICTYNLISEADMQNYEYRFRKQYYDIDLEKKNYEISKNFVLFFNNIITKFVTNNNLSIKSINTTDIIEKIYKRNKLSLLNNIAKIITNNSICFNEGTIYINGVGDFYHGLEKIEILEYNKNLAKKRKRNATTMVVEKISNDAYEPKKKNILKLSKKININNKEMNDDYQMVNNMIDINESVDKKNKKLSISIISNDNGDMNEDYYKCFRTLKKYTFPNLP